MTTPESPPPISHYRITLHDGKTRVVSDTCATMALIRVLETGEEIAGWEVVDDPALAIADGQNQTQETT